MRKKKQKRREKNKNQPRKSSKMTKEIKIIIITATATANRSRNHHINAHIQNTNMPTLNFRPINIYACTRTYSKMLQYYLSSYVIVCNTHYVHTFIGLHILNFRTIL